MLNASKVESQSNFKRPDALPTGAYPARIVQIISIGLQKMEFQGEEKAPQNKILVTYELMDEFLLDEEGNEDTTKPRWVTEEFALHSLDSDKATSTIRYLALDPRMEHGGDWSALISMPVTVTLVEKKTQDGKRTYNKVSGATAMREKDAAKAPDLVNKAVVFDLDEPDMEAWNDIQDWVKKKITEDNLDFKGSKLEKLLEGGQSGSSKSESKGSQKKEEAVTDAVSESQDVSNDDDW